MNTLQLEKALQGLKANTIGVYASDRIPITLSRPAAIVINTEENWRSGLHWVALYINKNGQGFYFDSYGMPPYISYHAEQIRRNCIRYIWNENQLQGYASKVCGQYCVVFLYYMAQGGNLKGFNKIFSSSTRNNDVLILKIYNKILNMNKKKNQFTNKYILDNSIGSGLYIQSCTSKICMNK